MSSSQVPAADGARYQPGAGGDHHGEGPHTGDHGHHAGDHHPPAADGEPTTLLGSAAAAMSRAGAAAVAAPVAAAATVSTLNTFICGSDINIVCNNYYKDSNHKDTFVILLSLSDIGIKIHMSILDVQVPSDTLISVPCQTTTTQMCVYAV